MKFRTSLISATVLAAGASLAAALSADAPLIEDQSLKVTAIDFEGVLLRLPEAIRPETRSSYERVATLIDSVYVGRVAAKRAREAGLDKDPAVQARLLQVQEGFLTELYLQHYDKQANMPNLEQRARELYKAKPKDFTKPEQVHVQHLLVSNVGRTREQALERAKQLRADIVAIKEPFTTIAKRNSDDPDIRRNNGDLGLNSPTSFEPQITAALAALKAGQVSDPIETRHGFHVVKLVERQPAALEPFEAVRDSLMRQERDRILKDRRDLLLQEIRDSKTVVIHKANVEALVRPIDMSKAGATATKK